MRSLTSSVAGNAATPTGYRQSRGEAWILAVSSVIWSPVPRVFIELSQIMVCYDMHDGLVTYLRGCRTLRRWLQITA